MDKESNQNNSQSNRGKLTLKLKLPTSSADPKTLALKNAENKRISNSLVQVTIKGRKKEATPTDTKSNSQTLNNNEFEARKKALNNVSEESAYQADEHQVLSKIAKATPAIKPKSSAEEKIKLEESIDSEQVVEKSVPEQIQESKSTDYKIDSFDVNSKIRKSIAHENQKKEEREKILEEKRKIEKEKLEKERVAKEAIEKERKGKLKKSGRPDDSSDDEFDRGNKKIKSAKEDKSTRRLLKTFIVNNAANSDDFGDGSYRRHKKQKVKIQESADYKKVTREVILPELIIVADLADRMSEKTGDVVKKLFTMGMVATSNQVIDADTAELVIAEFGHTAKRVTESDVENILNDEDDSGLPRLERAPVVTIMGHVDHGKTSLLDAIRSTDVAGGESGGITQHIGASRVKTSSGKFITFLDTPGHEAFTEMRSRGANATDIVVLVVAADDGVKEQTVEAISHAKAAGVPIIVAVNKIDKHGADSSRVKNELLQHEIISEDMGGEVMFIEVSAKQKINLDKLEEAILLQSEVLELKAPYEGMAKGIVIETRVDPSKGVVATVLVQKGVLNISDLVVAGTSYGKVRKMSDDRGKNIKEATPSMAVEILGLDFAPNAGDPFCEVTEEKQARDIISYRSKKERDEKSLKNSARSVSDIFKQSGQERTKYLPMIIKADVHGSVEAICGSLVKLNTEEVAIKIIHSATGGITESDISLASVSGAIIIGFNVRANTSAKDLAKNKNIDVRYHSIIYNVVDETKLMLGGMLAPIKTEEYQGQAEIRQVFKVSGAGKIAGCTVIDGTIKKGSRVRLLRENVVIHDGMLKTLKRFKEDVKEAKTGFECGVALENYDDIKEKDIIECYDIVEQKRSI